MRISKRTGKKVRSYKYNISQKELVKVNKARSKAQVEILSNPKRLKARAKRQTDIYWSDPVKQAKKSAVNHKTQSNPKRRKKQAETTRASWLVEEVREARIKNGKIAQSKPEYGEKIRSAQREIFDNQPERASLIIQKRLQGTAKFKGTSLGEENVRTVIELMKLPYKHVGDGSFMIGTYCPDFVHKSKKAIIEVYGDYHHNLPANVIHDKKRNKYIKSLGYKILILRGKDIKHLNKLVLKLKRFNARL